MVWSKHIAREAINGRLPSACFAGVLYYVSADFSIACAECVNGEPLRSGGFEVREGERFLPLEWRVDLSRALESGEVKICAYCGARIEARV